MTGLELLPLIKGILIEEIIEDAINETSEQGADALAAQMATGIDGAGKRLDDYTNAYKKRKPKIGIGLGKVTDRRTNYLTGAHYKGLYIKAYNGSIEAGSTDQKSKWIQEQSGDNIYKLGEDAKEEYAPAHLKIVQQRIEQRTGLKFE